MAIAERIVDRDHGAHGVAENDDREAGTLLSNVSVDGFHVLQKRSGGRLWPDMTERSTRRRGRSMAAMVMRIDVETVFRQKIRKTGIAGRMLCNTMVDLNRGTDLSTRPAREKAQIGAGRRYEPGFSIEAHLPSVQRIAPPLRLAYIRCATGSPQFE